jgi:hypothetical protein
VGDPAVTKRAIGAAVVKALVAGVVASVVFALFTAVWFGVGGEGFWRPLNLIAHTVWRKAPTDGALHVPSVLLGAITLLVVGVLVMAPFAAVGLGARLGAISLILGAGIYANVVWVFGHNLMWRALDPYAAAQFSPGVAWAAHIIAGLAGGTTLALLNTIGGRPAAQHHEAGQQNAQRV